MIDIQATLLARAADALESLHKPAQGDFDHLISELRKAPELDFLKNLD
jgi:hypothetical protein